MITRIRRRISLDEGVTLVETLMAVLVLTVALFGLMGSFIASAQSQLSQRNRTAATRVMTEHLEGLRHQGHEALKDMLPAGTYELTTSTDKTVDGVTYTITTTLQEVDADYDSLPSPSSVCPSPPTLSPPAGCPRHLRVTTINAHATVSWDVKGQTLSASSRTAIAPTKPDDSRDILAITFFPEEPFIDNDGQPTADVTVSTQLKGFVNSPQTDVRLSYWDDDGMKGPLTMAYDSMSSSGRWWKATINHTDIYRPLPDGEDVADLRVLIEVTDLSDGTTFSQTQTVQVHREPPPPSILSENEDHPIIALSSIPVHFKDVKVRGTVVSKQHYNIEDVTVALKVNGLNTFDPNTNEPLDNVYMVWQDHNGNWMGYPPRALEPLTYDHDTGMWERTFVADSQGFQPGSAQPFYFQAVRYDGVTSTYRMVTRPVVTQ